MGVGFAYNPFTREYEVPFPTISRLSRGKAEAFTGRTIEDSYEDFLHAFLSTEDEILTLIERAKNG